MAVPATRSDFKEYVLRKLGKGVINIDVSDAQVEDRIDEALNLYAEQHFNGTEHLYYKAQITQEAKDNKYITMPQNIIGVVQLYPIIQSGGRIGDIFDIQYQIMLNDLYNLTTVSIVPYVTTMTHLNTLQEFLVGRIPIRYNRHGNRLYIDADWNRYNVGEWLLVEAHGVLDPATYTDIWGERWLQNYTAALVRRQWGMNLSKFQGIQLPGGVTLNGGEIVAQAEAEIQKLEDELRERYTMPPIDFVG